MRRYFLEINSHKSWHVNFKNRFRYYLFETEEYSEELDVIYRGNSREELRITLDTFGLREPLKGGEVKKVWNPLRHSVTIAFNA